MPVRNEIEYITKAINSVLYQSISDDSYEIIAVDGNSTDGTHELLNKLAAEHPHLCVIQNKNKIVSTGFNLALNKAKGKYILRVDGHCELPQNYVEKCQYLLEENNASITGGRIKTVSDGIIGNAISTAQSSFFGVGGVPFRTTAEKKTMKVDTLAFGLHSRELFSSLGGYDEEMVCNQDDEFNFRVIQSGGKILLEPALVVTYYSRSNFFQLFKQYYKYGFYKVRGIQKRNSLFSIRHIFPSAFVIGILCGVIFGIVNQNWAFLGGIFGIYSLLNGISSIILSNKVIEIPLIFFATLVLHISYGLGFIKGNFYFASKWKNNSVADSHFDKKQFDKLTKKLTHAHSVS